MTYLNQSNAYFNKYRTLIYDLALIFSVLYLLRYATLWSAFRIFDFLYRYLAFFFSTLLFFSSLIIYDISGKLIFIFVVLLSLIVGYNSSNIELLFYTSVLVLGAKRVSLKNIIKVFFYTGLIFCLLNIVGNYLGMIPDALFVGEKTDLFIEGMNRKSFGYDWCTDFASHVFYITLSYWIFKRGVFNKVEYVSIIVLSFFILYETGTRMTSGLLLILVILSLFYKHRGRYRISKVLWYILIISAPLCLLLSLFLTLQYDETNIYWNVVDIFSSGRLHLGQEAIAEKGVPWLGQTYKMYGSGNSLDGEFYNYIDNSYIQYLVINGIVASLLMIMCNVFLCYRAFKRNDCLLALAVLLSSIFGVITQFHFNIGFCPLLLATYADISSNKLKCVAIYRDKFRPIGKSKFNFN